MEEVRSVRTQGAGRRRGRELAPWPGTTFKDLPDGPEMVVIPRGKLQMGSPGSELHRLEDEGPVHEVAIDHELAVAKYPVTRGEWRRYLAESGPSESPGAFGWFVKKPKPYSWSNPGYPQEDSHPAVWIRWEEATAYAAWLAGKTGQRCRLLSEAEFEYSQRGGSQTAYSWGDRAEGMQLYTQERSNYRELKGTWAVGRFQANAFGLHDMTGHVWCWTQDL